MTCQKVWLGQEDLGWGYTLGHRVRSVIQLAAFQRPHRYPFCLPRSTASDDWCRLPNHPPLSILAIYADARRHPCYHCNVLDRQGWRLWSGNNRFNPDTGTTQHSTASEHGRVTGLCLTTPQCTHVCMHYHKLLIHLIVHPCPSSPLQRNTALNLILSRNV